MGKKNDFVLLEGNEGNKGFLDDKVIAYGWDNEKIFNKQAQVIKKILELKNQMDANPTQKTPEQKKEEEYLWKKIHSYHQKRNQALIQSVTECLSKYPHSKIFVLSGVHHLVKKDYNVLDFLPKEEKYVSVIFNITKKENEIGKDYLQQFVAKIFP